MLLQCAFAERGDPSSSERVSFRRKFKIMRSNCCLWTLVMSMIWALHLGCYSQVSYTVQPDAIERVRTAPRPCALPAVREGKNPQPTYLACEHAESAEPSGDPLRIRTKLPNRWISAGSALTYLGSVGSVVGS